MASQIFTIRRILEGYAQKTYMLQYYLLTLVWPLTPFTEERWNKLYLAYGLPKETFATIMMLYRNAKIKVRSPDGDTDYIYIYRDEDE